MTKGKMTITNRRHFLKLSAATLVASKIPAVLAAPTHQQHQDQQPAALPSSTLNILYSSNHDCNGIAVSSDGKKTFLAFPRFGGEMPEYSVAQLNTNGSVTPFPDNHWNKRGHHVDPEISFIAVNAIHIFKDDTLWVVDQGSTAGESPAPGAQKMVQIDIHSGQILNVLRFSSSILPKGAQLNDLRIHGRYIFFTDSGLGGIVIHDQKTGHTLRRLSQQPIMSNDAEHPLKGSGGRILLNAKGERPITHSNQIEVDPTGTWLYFAPLIGPLRKVRVRDLLDTRLNDEELAKRVSLSFSIPSTNGTCMDSRGNFFISDAENNRIIVISPEGKRAILVTDPRIISPDALFIDHERNLYIPCAQVQYTAGNNRGKTAFHLPFYAFKLALPTSIHGIPLGEALG